MRRSGRSGRARTRAAAALGLAVLAGALVACGGRETGRAPCPDGRRCLEFGNQDEPGSLDPHHTTGTWEKRILDGLLIGLTQPDILDQPVPGMAESWTVSADGRVWTFRLREAVWSDGVPVTAEDFAFSLRRALDPTVASPNANLLYVIRNAKAVNAGEAPPSALGVRAVSPRLLEISLEHPAPYLPELAKSFVMMPVPRHVVLRLGDRWSDPRNHVSNGPYVVRSWRLGDRVQVLKNPRFWDAGKVCFDQVNYYPTTDSVGAERRVASGELDLNMDFQSSRADYLRKRLPQHFRSQPYLSTSYLLFSPRHPALRDRRVRQALAMAVDVDFIASRLMRAGQQPAYSFVPTGTSNYPGTARLYWAGWPYERRQARARQLLKEAGYGPGAPLRIEVKHRNQPDPMLYMSAIIADWRAVGVIATPLQQETQVAYATYRAGNYQIAELGRTADYNDAKAFLWDFRSREGRSYPGYSNPRFDALLDQSDQEGDARRRGELLARAEQVMLDDTPIVPIYFSVNRALVNPQITGYLDTVTGQHPVRYLCRRGPQQRPDRSPPRPLPTAQQVGRN